MKGGGGVADAISPVKCLEIHTERLLLVVKSASPRRLSDEKALSSLGIEAEGLKKVTILSEEKAVTGGEIPAIPLFFEGEQYEFVIESLKGEKLRATLPEITAVTEAGTLLSGVVDLSGFAGFLPFDVSSGEETLLSLSLEVFPARLCYKEDHLLMRREVFRMAMESTGAEDYEKSLQAAFDDFFEEAEKRGTPPGVASALDTFIGRTRDIYPSLAEMAEGMRLKCGKENRRRLIGDRELYRRAAKALPYITFSGEVFSRALGDVASLYRDWCFLKIADLLQKASWGGEEKKFRLLSPGPLAFERRGVTFSRTMRAEDILTGEKLTLDMLRGEGETVFLLTHGERKVLFYPAYHAEGDAPREKDLDSLRRIRETAFPESEAYVLYPVERAENVAYFPGEKVRGLPLLPDVTEYLAEVLGSAARDGEKCKLDDLPLEKTDWETRDTLVGSVRNETQYKLNLEGDFYYTAVKNLPGDALNIRYVALCRSKSWQEAGIRVFGEVEEIQKVKRSDIPVPMTRKNGDEDCYLFRVKGWEELEKPVEIREEGVYAPRLTSFFLLTHAKDTWSLFHVHSEEKFRLSNAVRMAAESERELLFELDEYHLLLARDDRVTLLRDGKIVDVIPRRDLARTPGHFTERITEVLEYGKRDRS